MKHLDNSGLITLCLDTYDDFWSDPEFTKLSETARELDSAIQKLNSIVHMYKIRGINYDYRRLQKDNPAYDTFLRLPKDEAEAFLYDLDYKKLQKFFLNLSYKKSLMKVVLFRKNLKALLIEVNYRIANYGKKSEFNINPNYPAKLPHRSSVPRYAEYD